MSLLHPTPGELMDRHSIVTLKLAAYRQVGKDTQQLQAESAELEERIVALPTLPLELSTELHKVNAALWQTEDRVRAADEGDKDELAFLAKHVARLNDERTRLMREIDRACGCEAPVEEKVYSRME